MHDAVIVAAVRTPVGKAPRGALRFEARLRLTGEMDVEVPPTEKPTAEALEAALEAASQLSEEELLEDVVEEFTFTLCPACRARLRADPMGASTVRSAPGRAPQ